MNLKKYIWKNRILLIETPSYKDENYIKVKELYQKNIKDFHKRFVKILTNRKKDLKFTIKLIGFDGEIKKKYKIMNTKDIFSTIDKMPLGHLKNKIKPKNLSLFSDYNPKTTIKGLGFKDKQKALYTVERIKKEPIKYQVNVVSTMLGRAKSHPHKTKSMEDAIKIFQKWLDDYKKNKN